MKSFYRKANDKWALHTAEFDGLVQSTELNCAVVVRDQEPRPGSSTREQIQESSEDKHCSEPGSENIKSKQIYCGSIFLPDEPEL